MKPAPPGWPRISSALFYDDARAAIDWLCEVFRFTVRLRIDGEAGRIEHSELTFDDGLIMVGSTGARAGRQVPYSSPRSLGGANTQTLCIYVDDVDAHHAHAVKCGAKVTRALATTDYGSEYWTDRSYEAEDPEGHRWFFVQRMRSPGEPAR
ncbi:MAG TPA: VOC family protein [Steroidobacteraceae bacterium]|nr:VOC family protein [Steroidobacteraceae bacterium]